MIWTQLNYSDLTGDVLQTEVTASLKPWQISTYTSLLHQQFSFPGTLNSAERSPIPSLQYIENSYSLAPEAVHLQKTGTKFNNKLNLSASSWLGLNKHLFLRQQKTHFIFSKITLELWRWFFFPASFSFAVTAIKDTIQFK